MNISTRLSLAAGACVAVVVAMGTFAVATTRDVRDELVKNEAATEIMVAVTGLRYLTLDHALYGEDRARVQWERRHRSLGALLERSRTTFAGDEESVDRLREAHRTTGHLFALLLDGATERRRARDGGVAAEFADRVTGQIIVRSETMIGEALALSALSRQRVLAAQRRSTITIGALGLVIVLVVGLTIPLALRSVTRRLDALRRGTAVIGAGDLDFRLAVRGRDELDELAASFNAMAARLRSDLVERRRAQDALERTRADLTHVARVATLGELLASIAHEVNQPLGAVVNNAGAGLRWLDAGNLVEARASAARVIEDGHRAGEILARIRAMVRKAPAHPQWMDVGDAIREVLSLAGRQATEHDVAIVGDLAEDLPRVHADRVQVQQVLLNLVVNAIEATAGGPAGSRRVVAAARGGGDGVEVAVRDAGSGIDAERQDRLFEPFHSTKPGGLGMGLAISRAIVEDHHGRLWATSNADGGATFHFTLPAGGGAAS